MTWIADFWRIAKKVDNLLELEQRQLDALDAFADRLTALEGRIDRIDAREEMIIVRSEAAARWAATIAASLSVADTSRRLGALEERLSKPVAKRLRKDP